MIRVDAKLHAALRRYLPPDAEGVTVSVELPDAATVADLVKALGIPEGYAKLVVDGTEQLPFTAPLKDGQSLQLFPPLAG